MVNGECCSSLMQTSVFSLGECTTVLTLAEAHSPFLFCHLNRSTVLLNPASNGFFRVKNLYLQCICNYSKCNCYTTFCEKILQIYYDSLSQLIECFRNYAFTNVAVILIFLINCLWKYLSVISIYFPSVWIHGLFRFLQTFISRSIA